MGTRGPGKLSDETEAKLKQFQRIAAEMYPTKTFTKDQLLDMMKEYEVSIGKVDSLPPAVAYAAKVQAITESVEKQQACIKDTKRRRKAVEGARDTAKPSKKQAVVRTTEGAMVSTREGVTATELMERPLQPGLPIDLPPLADEVYWARFFALVASSGGNVKRACSLMNLERHKVWLLARNEPGFKLRLEDAKSQGVEALEDEMRRRAYEGIERPVGFFQGVSTTTETVYSDTLLMFALKAAKPDVYTERTKNENVNVNVTLEEAAAARKAVLAKLEALMKPKELIPDSEKPEDAPPQSPLARAMKPENVVPSAPEPAKPVTNWDVED